MTAPGRSELGLLSLRQRLDNDGSGPAVGAWSAVAAVVSLVVVGLLGLALKQPWIFPSLGPTVMVLAETPRQPSAHPRNVLVGHAVGIAAGDLALGVAALTTHRAVIQEGLTGRRIVGACVSMALTALALQVLRSPHPPAGATTLTLCNGLFNT